MVEQNNGKVNRRIEINKYGTGNGDAVSDRSTKEIIRMGQVDGTIDTVLGSLTIARQEEPPGLHLSGSAVEQKIHEGDDTLFTPLTTNTRTPEESVARLTLGHGTGITIYERT